MALFSIDSKFMRFVGQLADILLLNLLWFAFCIPVVTIGASTVAAYSVAMKMLDDEEGYIARSFLKAFKANFAQGTVIWLLNAVAIYALYIDWQIVIKSADPSFLLIVISIVTTAFVFFAFVYAYPITARYENSTGKILGNSVKLCFRYPGKTFILLIVVVLEAGLFIWNTPMLIAGILVGPMILVYTIGGIAKRIFLSLES